MMPVELRNEQRAVRVDVRRLRRQAESLLASVGRSDSVLSILLTDDRRIAPLHERWMGEPGPTDVLSFPMQELGAGVATSRGRAGRSCQPRKARGGGVAGGVLRRRRATQRGSREVATPALKILGDIVISAETAARRRPKDPAGEILRYLVHGLLHLTGRDHRTARERLKMDRETLRLQGEAETA